MNHKISYDRRSSQACVTSRV